VIEECRAVPRNHCDEYANGERCNERAPKEGLLGKQAFDAFRHREVEPQCRRIGGDRMQPSRRQGDRRSHEGHRCRVSRLGDEGSRPTTIEQELGAEEQYG
jgi:hypothetical protein